MNTKLRCPSPGPVLAAVAAVAAVAGILGLIAVFHAWLEPSLALALLGSLFLCQ